MRIGYACQTIGVPGAVYRTCMMKNASDEKLMSLIAHNLQALEAAIDYNIRNGISLFRITSDLIPFGSSPVNALPWMDIFKAELAMVGQKIISGGLRVSMHPGQYTVLNSTGPDVAGRAAADLAYHQAVLDGLSVDDRHKIILHVGSISGGKPLSAERFVSAWRDLAPVIRNRLVIENDEKNFNIADVLLIGRELRIPVVFDVLHHQLNEPELSRPSSYWIKACRETWQPRDGCQKIHYSQQDPDARAGAHSRTIKVRPFLDFCRGLEGLDPDIMLEVKDKNLSARKCMLCISPQPCIMELEKEWSRYKYKILENAPADYQAIRTLFRERRDDFRLDFFDLADHGMAAAASPGSAENAALHVWGYFRDVAEEGQKQAFFKALDCFLNGRTTIRPVKQLLQKLVDAYRQDFLADSYYFLA